MRFRAIRSLSLSGTIECMTTAEKEKRILDLGKPWKEIMQGLSFHRTITKEEESSPHRDGIMRAREDYYSSALSVILDCADKSK